jgi:spore germination protein KC
VRRRGAILARVVAIILGSPTLTGCWGVPPIEQVGMVTLMAIDQAPKGGFKVTVSVDMPSSSSASPGLGQMSHALVRQTTGRTLLEAIDRLRTESYLTLSFDHLEALFVSQAVASAGLASALSDMTTSPEFVSTTYLLVVPHGAAGTVIDQIQSAKPRPEVVVSNTIDQIRSRTPYRPKLLYDFLERVQLPGDAFATAGAQVNLAQPGGDAGATLQVQGEAMFDRDRLVGWLDRDQTLGWAMATGQVGHPVVGLATPGGGYELEVLGIRRAVRIVPSTSPPGVSAELDISVRTRLGAAQAVPVSWWSNPHAVTQLAAAAATRITQDVMASLRSAQADKADVFGLGEHVRVQNGAAWSRLGPRWDMDAFPRLHVRVRVHVTINDLGTLVCPPFQRCGVPPNPV